MATKSGTKKTARIRPNPVRIWHLISNHQNMLYMLAAGMVMGPAGFRGKHYSDPSDIFPGWIPLFRNKADIPEKYLRHAISERKHLLPCIASFDLNELAGPCKMLSRDGSLRDVISPAARKRKNDIAILVRAPFPLTLMVSVNFNSSEDLQSFERAANDVSNVDLSPYRLEVEKALFSTSLEAVSFPASAQDSLLPSEESVDKYPAFEQALGGVLAMLYQTANRSELGVATYRQVTGAPRKTNGELVKSDPILAELPVWMEAGKISEDADIRVRLFFGVVQELINSQAQACRQTPIDVVLIYLEKQLAVQCEESIRKRLGRLIEDMRSSLGLGGGTITELLERNEGSLSRPLLLFCLREHCIDLLEFTHPLITDTEYILAGILFGVRESWLQLPKELRGQGMAAYVAYHMVCADHRSHGGNLALKAPKRPIPLREIFNSTSGEWNKVKESVALDLASACNWNDCIQTRITLTERDAPEHFERIGLEVVLPGRVIQCEVLDKAKFMLRLGQSSQIHPLVELDVRNQLLGLPESDELASTGSNP